MLIPQCAPSPFDELLVLAERNPALAVSGARQQWQHASCAVIQAWAAYTLGWTLLRWNQLSEAQHYLQIAADAYCSLDLPILVLHCRRALLIAHLFSGTTTNQHDTWDALIADYHAAGLPIEAARSRIHQIAYLNVLGTPHMALALARQIEAYIQEQGTQDDQARLFRVMAIASKQTGLLTQATTLLEQAQALFANLGFMVEVAKCLLEQAHIWELCGSFEQAHRQINRALTLFQQFDMPLQVAACEKTLGLIASRLGQLGHALTFTLRARSTFLSLGQYEQAGGCDLNLGNIAYYSGLFDLALAAYKRAQTVYADIGVQRDALVARRN